MFCTKCGTEFQGRYCPSCGTLAGAPAGSGTGTGAGTVPPATDVPPPYQMRTEAGVPSNWASVLCYVVPVIGPLIFLFLAPYNRDRKIRFDAWQGLFVHLTFIAAGIVIGVFYAVNWNLGNLLSRMVDLAFLAVVVFMAVKAYQNEKYILPMVGPWAEKQK